MVGFVCLLVGLFAPFISFCKWDRFVEDSIFPINGISAQIQYIIFVKSMVVCEKKMMPGLWFQPKSGYCTWRYLFEVYVAYITWNLKASLLITIIRESIQSYEKLSLHFRSILRHKIIFFFKEPHGPRMQQVSRFVCTKGLFVLKCTYLNNRRVGRKGKQHLEAKEVEQMSFSCVFYWFINTQSGSLVSAE